MSYRLIGLSAHAMLRLTKCAKIDGELVNYTWSVFIALEIAKRNMIISSSMSHKCQSIHSPIQTQKGINIYGLERISPLLCGVLFICSPLSAAAALFWGICQRFEISFEIKLPLLISSSIYNRNGLISHCVLITPIRSRIINQAIPAFHIHANLLIITFAWNHSVWRIGFIDCRKSNSQGPMDLY